MGLVLHPDNVIRLWTRHGECEIQLLSGDITQLPVEEKMDIIMVSAFPGDYAPLGGTVIGALRSRLGINVAKLANDKGLDLRHHFSCWLSKDIPVENSPYRRLLCFERRRVNLTVAQQISEMFRVFVPVFNNQENTVITPILATGHQGHDTRLILGRMVSAAAHWIEAGLPLRCLKLVIYGPIKEQESILFSALKTKLMTKNDKMKKKIFKKTYDVYITFSMPDQHHVNHIRQSLQTKKTDIKVYSEHKAFNKDKVWQDEIFKTMIACKRVIAVLSQAFLEDTECLEQYNMAMCCNRLIGMEILVPFYIQTVTNLPAYMGLIQWVDCRVRKEGEEVDRKLSSACINVVQHLEDNKPTNTGTADSTNALFAAEEDKYMYDVFISYSHKIPLLAEATLNAFSEVDDKVKVFYDRSSLTTGGNWQNTLYQSLGSARCIIVLMSPAYLHSVVCMEEYSIAIARFLAMDNDMQFIPICVEDMEDIPSSLAAVKLLDARGVNFSVTVNAVAQTVVDWLHNRKPKFPEILNTVQSPIEMINFTSKLRSDNIHKQYTVDQQIGLIRSPPLDLPKSDRPVILDPENIKEFDIVLSYGNDSVHCAGTFCHIVDSLYENLTISVITDSGHNRLQALDKAKVIVLFISKDFMRTHHFMEELHMALCRQRADKKKVVYLVKTTPLMPTPFFQHLLPFDVDFNDQAWFDLEKKYIKRNKVVGVRKVVSSGRMEFRGNFTCDYVEYFALSKTAHDVVLHLLSDSDNSEDLQPNILNVVEMQMRADPEKQAELGRQYLLQKCLRQVDLEKKSEEKDEKHDEILPRFQEKKAESPKTAESHRVAESPEVQEPAARNGTYDNRDEKESLVPEPDETIKKQQSSQPEKSPVVKEMNGTDDKKEEKKSLVPEPDVTKKQQSSQPEVSPVVKEMNGTDDKNDEKNSSTPKQTPGGSSAAEKGQGDPSSQSAPGQSGTEVTPAVADSKTKNSQKSGSRSCTVL